MLSIYTHLIDVQRDAADAGQVIADQDALIMEATELIMAQRAHRKQLERELAQERTRSSLRGGIVRVQRTRLRELAAQLQALEARHAGLAEVYQSTDHELASLKHHWRSVVQLAEERREQIVSLNQDVKMARQEARAYWAQKVEDLESQLQVARNAAAFVEAVLRDERDELRQQREAAQIQASDYKRMWGRDAQLATARKERIAQLELERDALQDQLTRLQNEQQPAPRALLPDLLDLLLGAPRPIIPAWSREELRARVIAYHTQSPPNPNDMKSSPITPAQRALARQLLRHQRQYNEVLGLMKAAGIEACVELPDGELRTLEQTTHSLRFRLVAQLVDPSWIECYAGEPEASFPGGLEDVNYPPVYPSQKPIQ